jgi:hypothetical protein
MNLDDLQAEVEKLLSLLNNRQPGLMSWNNALYERLKNIKELAEKAGFVTF